MTTASRSALERFSLVVGLLGQSAVRLSRMAYCGIRQRFPLCVEKVRALAKSVTRQAWERQRALWLSSPWPTLGYLFVVTGLLVSIASISLRATASWMNVGIALCLLGGVIGFVTTTGVTIFRLLRAAFWQSWFGRLLVVLTGAAVSTLAAAISHNLVADSLGLPPHDFSLTTAAVTLVSLFLLLLAGLLALFAIIYLFALACMATLTALTALSIPAFLPALAEKLSQLQNRFWRGAILNLTGSIAFIWVLLLTVDGVSNSADQLHRTIRFIAYFADFHHLHAFPGVDRAARTRLHENGIVSVARWKDGQVVISVHTYPLLSGKREN